MRSYIPTPGISSFGVGPLTIHIYALCIILGASVAIYVGKRRSPNNSTLISELAIYVIPAGILGARLYHVITTPEKYFNKHFFDIFKIWQGGLGIWGAIFGGAIAAFFLLKKRGIANEFFVLADALAPGILIAQAIGRFGNWFNGELFGGPTRLPWGLEIPVEKRPINYLNYTTFHPTFLYEALWCILVAIFILQLEFRRPGQAFWMYVCLYSLGRIFFEWLRIDYSHLLLGVRLNVWVAIICMLIAARQFLKLQREQLG